MASAFHSTAFRISDPRRQRVGRLPDLFPSVVPSSADHLSSRFKIFPVAVIGRLSRNSIMRGYLYAAMVSLHHVISSASVIVAPALRMMKALTSSPLLVCGT